jgi:hypothetical protein
MRSNVTDIMLEKRHETDKAVLFFTGDKTVWLAKRQIEVEPAKDGKLWIVTLPEWLAEEKGLV